MNRSGFLLAGGGAAVLADGATLAATTGTPIHPFQTGSTRPGRGRLIPSNEDASRERFHTTVVAGGVLAVMMEKANLTAFIEHGVLTRHPSYALGGLNGPQFCNQVVGRQPSPSCLNSSAPPTIYQVTIYGKLGNGTPYTGNGFSDDKSQGWGYDDFGPYKGATYYTHPPKWNSNCVVQAEASAAIAVATIINTMRSNPTKYRYLLTAVGAIVQYQAGVLGAVELLIDLFAVAFAPEAVALFLLIAGGAFAYLA